MTIRNFIPFQARGNLLFLLLLVPLFQGCGKWESPKSNKILPLNFDHTGLVDGCSACHKPSGEAIEAPANHQTFSAHECNICHKTNSWFNFAKPHEPNLPVPNQCAACHKKKLPTKQVGKVSLQNNLQPVGGFFDHSENGGNGECANCHLAPKGATRLKWSNAVFVHDKTINKCFPCHTAAQLPLGPVGTPAFDHSEAGGKGDCVSCHDSQANLGKTWQQAEFTHSPLPANCSSCHASDLEYTKIQNTIIHQMNHSSLSQLPDCSECHSKPAAAREFKNWETETIANGDHTPLAERGNFHGNISARPVTCANCHANERPQDNKSHSGPSTSKRKKVNFVHNDSYGTECNSCHSIVPEKIGISWSKGFFDHFKNDAGKFSNCSPCHASTYHHLWGGFRSKTNCIKCHKITWPRPSPDAKYGGEFGSGWK